MGTVGRRVAAASSLAWKWRAILPVTYGGEWDTYDLECRARMFSTGWWSGSRWTMTCRTTWSGLPKHPRVAGPGPVAETSVNNALGKVPAETTLCPAFANSDAQNSPANRAAYPE